MIKETIANNDPMIKELEAKYEALISLFGDGPDPKLASILDNKASKSPRDHGAVVSGLFCGFLSHSKPKRDAAFSLESLLRVSQRNNHETLGAELVRLTDNSDRFDLMHPVSRRKILEVTGGAIKHPGAHRHRFKDLILSLARQMVGVCFRTKSGEKGDVDAPWVQDFGLRFIAMLDGNLDWVKKCGEELVSGLIYNLLGMIYEHKSQPKLRNWMEAETKLCVRLMQGSEALWPSMGRDFVRALQRVKQLPGLAEIWRALNEAEGGKTLTRTLAKPTSSKLLTNRLAPAMIKDMMYMFTRIKMGQQGSRQKHFSKKFFKTDASDLLRPDITRYICGAYHPSNRVLASQLLTRWAQLGWLYATAHTPHARRSIMEAVLWDLFYFNPRVDTIMNIEPAALLLTRSVPKYPNVSAEILHLLNRSTPAMNDRKTREDVGAPESSVAAGLRKLIHVKVILLRDLQKVVDFPKIPSEIKKVFSNKYRSVLKSTGKLPASSPSSSPSSTGVEGTNQGALRVSKSKPSVGSMQRVASAPSPSTSPQQGRTIQKRSSSNSLLGVEKVGSSNSDVKSPSTGSPKAGAAPVTTSMAASVPSGAKSKSVASAESEKPNLSGRPSSSPRSSPSQRGPDIPLSGMKRSSSVGMPARQDSAPKIAAGRKRRSVEAPARASGILNQAAKRARTAAKVEAKRLSDLVEKSVKFIEAERSGGHDYVSAFEKIIRLMSEITLALDQNPTLKVSEQDIDRLGEAIGMAVRDHNESQWDQKNESTMATTTDPTQDVSVRFLDWCLHSFQALTGFAKSGTAPSGPEGASFILSLLHVANNHEPILRSQLLYHSLKRCYIPKPKSGKKHADSGASIGLTDAAARGWAQLGGAPPTPPSPASEELDGDAAPVQGAGAAPDVKSARPLGLYVQLCQWRADYASGDSEKSENGSVPHGGGDVKGNTPLELARRRLGLDVGRWWNCYHPGGGILAIPANLFATALGLLLDPRLTEDSDPSAKALDTLLNGNIVVAAEIAAGATPADLLMLESRAASGRLAVFRSPRGAIDILRELKNWDCGSQQAAWGLFQAELDAGESNLLYVQGNGNSDAASSSSELEPSPQSLWESLAAVIRTITTSGPAGGIAVALRCIGRILSSRAVVAKKCCTRESFELLVASVLAAVRVTVRTHDPKLNVGESSLAATALTFAQRAFGFWAAARPNGLQVALRTLVPLDDESQQLKEYLKLEGNCGLSSPALGLLELLADSSLGRIAPACMGELGDRVGRLVMELISYLQDDLVLRTGVVESLRNAAWVRDAREARAPTVKASSASRKRTRSNSNSGSDRKSSAGSKRRSRTSSISKNEDYGDDDQDDSDEDCDAEADTPKTRSKSGSSGRKYVRRRSSGGK